LSLTCSGALGRPVLAMAFLRVTERMVGHAYALCNELP
jgi:hypothetical protein